jgi:hypothetical protein
MLFRVTEGHRRWGAVLFRRTSSFTVFRFGQELQKVVFMRENSFFRLRSATCRGEIAGRLLEGAEIRPRRKSRESVLKKGE